MNNYNGYILDEYAGDYLEEIENYVVLPVKAPDNSMFYGLFKFAGAIPYCSKEAKRLGLEKEA